MRVKIGNPKELFNKVEKLYRAVFKKTPFSYFEKRILHSPFDDKLFYIEDNGNIVSSIILYKREFNFYGKSSICGGIGNVSTLNEYRGRGFSSKILEEIIRYSKDEGYSFLLLFTEINGFYERLGFKTVRMRKPLFERNKREDLKGFEVKKISFKDHFSEVIELWNEFSSFSPILIKRDENYWKYLYEFSMSDDEVYGLFLNNKLLSYMVLNEDEKKGELKEIAFLDGDYFRSLLDFHLTKKGLKVIESSFMVGKNISIPHVLRFSSTNILMVYPLNKDITLEKFENDFAFFWSDEF